MKTSESQAHQRKLPSFSHFPLAAAAILVVVLSCAVIACQSFNCFTTKAAAKVSDFEVLYNWEFDNFHNNKDILNHGITYSNDILIDNRTNTIITVPSGPICPPRVSRPSANRPSAGRHERTLIMLKPDSVQRGLIGTIINRFEAKGFKLVGLKLVWPSEELVEQHYADSVGRAHFVALVKFISSGPVIPMVWEGLNVIQVTRRMLGHSNPIESMPGTIRGDFSADRERSIIHGSDTPESAKREINLWFSDNELVSWSKTSVQWLYA